MFESHSQLVKHWCSGTAADLSVGMKQKKNLLSYKVESWRNVKIQHLCGLQQRTLSTLNSGDCFALNNQNTYFKWSFSCQTNAEMIRKVHVDKNVETYQYTNVILKWKHFTKSCFASQNPSVPVFVPYQRIFHFSTKTFVCLPENFNLINGSIVDKWVFLWQE